MDDSALQQRLERIERRQSYLLVLVAGLYVFAALWLLVRELAAITAWHVAVGLVAVGVLVAVVGTYRRRQAST